VIEYLRLAFGTFCVFLPGALVARALGQRSTSATLAWALASAFVAWAVVFTVHGSIHLAVIVLVVVALAAALAWRRRQKPVSLFEPGSRVSRRSRAPVWLFGLVLGWFLWQTEGPIAGDGLFHEARVRKLVAFGDLHLRTVDEFKDGGLHPGYAFPLWHGFLALISWFSGLDPGSVVRHEPSLLAPIACVLVYEAGVAVFRSHWAGYALLVAQLSLVVFGAGHGGSYSILTLPATTSKQLLVPATIALFFAGRGPAGLAALAAMFGVLTLTHPTYALFLLLPFVAFAAIRSTEWRVWLPRLTAALVPTGLVLVWLKPIVDETLSHDPGPAERARALAHYGSQLVVTDDRHYRLAAGVLGRTGALAVATLLLLPVLGLAFRYRWAAFALAGTVVILALMEVPWLFVHLSDAVSLSQSRRAAGFAPLAFAAVGVAALVARRIAVLPLAFVAGVVLQRLWPGDFDNGLRHGGPALATWIALVGGAAALAAGVALRHREPPREHFALGFGAVACFALATFVHGIWHWSPDRRVAAIPLAPSLVHELRTTVPKGAVVLAPLSVSYRAAADAPVYIVAAPVEHVANTRANDPNGRARAVRHWVLTGDPRVARRYGATWAIRNGRLTPISG
jgi:hypothetical protein